MTTKYIFDVDGTLTPSRQRINRDFAVWFSKFCETHAVYLVTGSDRPKTIEQVGEYIYYQCKLVYNCSGNDVWKCDTNVRTSSWVLPETAEYFLNSCLYESDFSLRTGNHIEERPGTVNFSVVGRNASLHERKQYVAFEEQNGERRKIADAFNMMFPDLQATVGGETGIDIAPQGADKSQILSDFKDTDKLLFVGDKCEEGGNDHAIAKAIAARPGGKFYNTEGWEQTWKILKNTQS